MSFWLAFLVCAVGVAGLFYLDRDKSNPSSKALWLPVIWLWIIGSRPVSDWLVIWFGWGQSSAGGLDAQLDGSPTDAVVFMLLAAGAAAVLFMRRRATLNLLKSSSPVLIYFSYCAASCLWSPFPDVTFKRWVKDVCDLAMALVIATDPQPLAALRRIFTRVGFILLPASMLLIRYSPLGQSYDPSGGQSYTGVTGNKNTLGLITFVILLGAMWSFYNLYRTKLRPDRTRQLVARGVLVAFGVLVLYEARSDTSTSSFLLGAFLVLVTSLSFFRRRPGRVHVLVLGILLAGVIGFFLGGTATVASAYGKNANLSDRTIIWAAVIPVCPNPILGAGFESFWNGYGKFVTGGLSKYERGLNSAHDGYIEIYLNLGWVGVSLIALLLFTAYRKAWAAFRINAEVGSLMLAFVPAIAIYNITEAGYRMLTPTWIFLLLVIVGAQRIASRASGKTRATATGRASSLILEPESPELTAVG